MSTDSTLVARAMPCALPASQSINGAEALIEDLKKLSLNKQNVPPSKPKEKKTMRTMDAISPADFVTLQSLRSSALARKTNTTSKFARDGANLFADLLAEEKINVTVKPESPVEEKAVEEKKEAAEKKEEVKVEKEEVKEKSEKKDDEKKEKSEETEKKAEEKDENEGELISRGPVRTTRTPVTFHPYGGNTLHYGAAAQSAVEDPTSYSAGYDNNYDYSPGQNWWYANRDVIASNSSTPDTLFSDNGYSSATSPQNYYNNYYQPPTASQQAYNYPQAAVPVAQAQQQKVPQTKTAEAASFAGFADHALTSSEINRLLSTNNEGETELPDSLSDFILKYSRRYTTGSEDVDAYTTIKNSFSPSSSSSSPQHHNRPLSADSGCDSPLSAGSAPQTSPAQPHGGISGPCTPSNDQHRYQSKTGSAPLSVDSQQRPAKEKLRALISDDDMDQAWAWTCKCMMYFPGALSYQDPDRDTLLHIVTKLMDFAKIYTLVERMLKLENASNHRMFDMPNKMNETPLFLAVERRCPEIVEYLLEAGANPNTQTLRHERDASLHYAATRGMFDVVSTICNHPRTNINAQNGMGLTPLLCAVKNHGSLEEESQRIIDSRLTIQQLLACGADPMIPDATNGRTVIHYVVDCMDPALVEIFKKSVSEETMTNLVNTPDLCMETPLNVLQSMGNIDESRRSALCMELITCGASNQTTKSQTNYELY
uniref:ANK_REP_REGION domain-containing protein n=1 Tax=Panagrolaimus sp. ES5 TaxID=591445 RepID=A0AC34FNL9_9BILA